MATFSKSCKNLELKDCIPLPSSNENEDLKSKYDLIASTVHDWKPDKGSYRVFVQQKSEKLWYEIQDLHVTESHPDIVALWEAYIQIYRQQH
ncbi:U4/U6.U5 tri-snRNP-associated protein 2-like [Thalictrum thalictroides]|uniref:U4/U6.U5 tri-snRNP-associated protein 2-like n=1 Tax=Thalictrum thalictroides TaxID=46969 RepID=A0A7J6VXK1_THATH|nr:U4/U6.U5 tri-snRNP-associated protein 2-like [Thalictrum thalictroides]